MNKNLPDTEPPIPANIGWQLMESLLQEYLPVKRQPIWRRMPFSAAAVLMVMLLLTALQLDTSIFHSSYTNSATRILSETKASVNKSAAIHIGGRITNIDKILNKKFYYRKAGKRVSFNNGVFLATIPTIQININPLSETEKEIVYHPSIINSDIEKQLRPTVLTASHTTIASIAKQPVSTVPEKHTTARSWSLLAGIGVNTSASQHQNLQPYPVAEARYHISQLAFVSAGFSLLSPVSTTTGGVSKTVYLNDRINNINLYNEITTYNDFHYADLPILMGINVTKNISLQSGVQMSVLLNKKTKKELEPYDFQMNRINVSVSSATTLTTPPQQAYEMQVRDMDYRFVTTLRYTYKKTCVGVMYQHALQSISKGTHADANRNHLVEVNVLLRLK